MAGSTRFDSAASSPEGSALTATYPNGQRGNYSGASLDRSGSFREGVENRMQSSGPGSYRGGAPSSAEMPPISNFLSLEPITMGDQKIMRSGELRRILVGSTLDEHSFGAAHSKPPPPIVLEDLKHFKASILDTSNKARDRVKRLNESIVKLDKYRHTLLTRKRRTESSERSGGASMLKMGSQIHQKPPDLVTQRLEDRSKNVIQNNKRVCTSITESEGRTTTISRQSVVMDKDREIIRAGRGGLVQVEENIRGLPAAGDGLDKKMKRKRSVGTVVTRAMDGDRELKRAMHQKFRNDPRSRSCDAHGFGSGPSNGITAINKLDGGTSQTTNSNARGAIPRNELDNDSFANDRRDRVIGLDKERIVVKGNNKHNACEDSQVGSPSPVTKGKASRAPRTGSGMANSSPNSSHTLGALDGWEQSPSLNKVQSVGGSNNRKRSIPTGSSSPPMAQWVGQRPPKNSRTRRANLVSPVSNNEEAQISSEGFPALDVGARLPSSEANGSLVPRGVSSNAQQFKMKSEKVPSPARFSESEESGAGENKLKEKGTDNGETEDRSVNTAQKIGPFMLPRKKDKLLIKEEIGDGVRRQGRSGRGSSLSRACILPMKEKLENPATTKPLQNLRPGSDKNESKSGRPPSKKHSDRKAILRPGHALNGGSSDMTGESEDDREELLAAANSAYSSRNLACSGSFWKKIEPIFASISSEDTAYLKQQLHFAAELDESLSHMFGTDCNVLAEQLHREVPSSLVSRERQGLHLNGVRSKEPGRTLDSLGQLQNIDTSDSKVDAEGRFENVTPLYQRVLSALIVEEETEEFDHSSERTHASFLDASDGSPCGPCIPIDDGNMVESEVGSGVGCRTQKHCLLDSFSCNGSTASNSFGSSSIHNSLYNDELWHGDDSSVHSARGVISGFVQNNLDGPQPMHTNIAGFSSFECQYQQLCLDDKILLELQSIGLYPEIVPDLAEGEEEMVNKDIAAFRKGLYRQARKKRGQLCKIDNVIRMGREMEGRDVEQGAMDKLVEIAYKKRMACRGGNASKNGVSRVSKQAALAFVKRTIDRCQKFEATGRSCFTEPALRDVIFSTHPYLNDPKFVDNVGSGAAPNTGVEADNIQPQSGASAMGATSTLVERHGLFGDKLDRGSSDAFQTPSHSSDQAFAKHELPSNRGKKKEVLLDDVAGSAASRASSALANTLLGGTKGRRSERDRDQNTSMFTRNSAAKDGHPALGSFRGERKTKSKPKQKTAQLSMSGNGLLGRATEKANPMYPSVHGSKEKMTNGSSKVGREVGISHGNIPRDSSKETEEPLDITKLPLHEIDSIDELGFSNNLSWLNFDEDGLLDHDSMGLEIPMDDLSDLNMIL